MGLNVAGSFISLLFPALQGSLSGWYIIRLKRATVVCLLISRRRTYMKLIDILDRLVIQYELLSEPLRLSLPHRSESWK